MRERQKQLSSEEKIDWLRLSRSQNVGPITFYKLLDRFGSVGGALDALPELARRGGAGRIRVGARAAAEAELETLHRLGAAVIGRGETAYPPLLAQIEDAPPLISVLGHSALLGKRTIAIVGTRNASINGQNLARKFAGELGAAGLLVVSGMARGIDAAAHEGALEAGTTAVLAGGIDVAYPKDNAKLYEKLIELGAIISEMPPGTVPKARHFPRRNRIISGMARAVLVVEAALRSGSLITARLALEQNREVFAVPGSPLDPRARGTNNLIRQGAHLTESADEVVCLVNDLFASPLMEREPFEIKQDSPPQPEEDELEEARRIIKNYLSPTPLAVDEIIRQCQMSSAVVSTILLELELASRLERHPGNQVSLIEGI